MSLDFDEGDELRALRVGGGRPRLPVRPGLLPGAGPHRRPHRRAVGRGGQGRVPRRQPARGVRRRGRRHGRAVDRAGGAGRGRLPAADDGRLAGDLRHGDRQVRHRRAEAALAARASPTARSPWRSRSPSPTPARTRTRSPPWPAGTATSGCSAARRCGSAASTRPTRCSSSASSRTSGRARCGRRCSSSPPTPRG